MLSVNEWHSELRAGRPFGKKRQVMIDTGDVSASIVLRRLSAGLAVVLGVSLTAACGSTTSAYLIGAGLANFVYTDKLPTDYLAEFASGQECNLLKSLKDEGPLCRDSFERVVYERPHYCYRTLGEINCYERRDSDRRSTTRVQ